MKKKKKNEPQIEPETKREPENNLSELRQSVQKVRQLIFETICGAGGGHIPTCLSVAEILTVLYDRILQVSPKTIGSPDRDRFILSKGHAGVALYCVLALKGFISYEMLATHGHPGTELGGHPDMYKVPGVEASTGALGHGLAFAAGMALAGKIDQKDYRVFTLMGDGECQEGSVWEAAAFAAQAGLDNLVGIVDYNKLQALDRLDKIVGLEPLADKWKAFGWKVQEVNGHDLGRLLEVFQAIPLETGRPTMIIAHTTKGKGISFMENVPIWHYRMPNEEEMKVARQELGLEEARS